jgi:uncharacterized tellurite resistance protein B-like protein
MLSHLKKLFVPEVPAVESDQPQRLQLATCIILLEVAGADDEFAPEECDHIIKSLCTRFSLSQPEAEELVETSNARRRKSFDLWQFTNQINQACTRDEKMEIIEEVWRVIYADGTLDAHEDYIAHKLAKLFRLNHPQLIAAKMKVLKEVRGA